MQEQLPVLLVTGFLGAGKTTLLNHLLHHTDKKIALIVNEFGAVSIDDKILDASGAEQIIELPNGALCCASHGDTEQVLTQLMEEKFEVDYVIIETTGLANPVPIAKSFLDRPSLKNRYTLDRIITVVDSSRILDQISTTHEAKIQIAVADVVLLNKTDLTDPRNLAATKMRIRSINPLANLIESEHSKITLTELLAGDAKQGYFEAVPQEDGSHDHDSELSHVVLTNSHALNLDNVLRWIGESLLLNSANLPRYKGILWIDGMDERFVFQGVHEHFENTKDRLWKDGEVKQSQVVVIGKELDQTKLQAEFDQLAA